MLQFERASQGLDGSIDLAYLVDQEVAQNIAASEI